MQARRAVLKGWDGTSIDKTQNMINTVSESASQLVSQGGIGLIRPSTPLGLVKSLTSCTLLDSESGR